MLEVKNLTAGYSQSQKIIKNISLKVNTGERICLLGPNGCGKTTLLKAIAGIIESSGEVLIDGKPFFNLPRKEIAKQIAVMEQLESIYFPYTVFQTVMLGRYAHIHGSAFSAPTKQDKQQVNKALEAVDLTMLKDNMITALSGGQLQRVFLARIIAQNPKIILLDEPTNHLDLKNQIHTIDFLKKHSEKNNITIIGVFHDLNLAMRLSDEMVFMKNGQLVISGNKEKVLNSKTLKEIYEMDVISYMRDISNFWKTK